MYLSKLRLNPRNQAARRDAGSPYELHRTLARAFPTPDGINYRETAQVLFRSELRIHNGRNPLAPTLEVLVQSINEPFWNELHPNYLISLPDTKVINIALSNGQEYAFRLVANPTRKLKQADRSQGKRIALPDFTTDDGPTPAREWLDRQGEHHGFQVLYVLTESFWSGKQDKERTTNKNNILIYCVRYEGLLRVTDAQKLMRAITKGIGPSKAFGCGLLSLAKP